MEIEKVIDCFLVGHNEVDFAEHEKRIRTQGLQSGAYRDLNLNFINYRGRPCTASQIPNTPITSSTVFSAAVAYLGTYLHRDRFSFDYIDSFQEEKDYFAQALTQGNILTVAVTTTLYVDVFPLLEIVEFIKKFNSTAKIVVGGPFILSQVRSLQPEQLQYLFQLIGADYYVYSSQGEYALTRILQTLKTGKQVQPGTIKNVYVKTGNGYIEPPIEPENNSLAENTVDWDLFSPRVGQNIAVRTAISCPFSCSFCGYPEYAGKYQTIPVDAIEKELLLAKEIQSVRHVNFVDDTFNVTVNRFKDILRMIIKNKFSFRWHSYFRCQFADEETVQLMKESGCEGVFLGLEAGSDTILKNMNKAADVQAYHRGIQLLKKYGIVTFGSFITGFPGETPQTVEETLQFIRSSGLDFFRVQLWFLDSTSPIARKKEAFGLEGANFQWAHNTMDAKTAADWVDHIFLSVNDPVWLPQYSFNLQGIFHLIDKGIGLDDVKIFLRSFNNSIREKLLHPSEAGSQGTSREIIDAFTVLNNKMQTQNPEPVVSDTLGKYEADFDL